MTSTKSVVWVLLVVLASAGTGLGSLSDGLMAYYPFTGNTNDATGNYPLPLTPVGAIPTSDRFGNANRAYSFDGVDDYMVGLSYDCVNPSAQGSFAVSFWFKPTTTWAPGDNPNSLVVGNYEPGDQLDWGIQTNLVWAETLYFWWTQADPGTLTTPPATFSAGTWYHVVADYDASTKDLSMWVNGVCGSHTAMIDDIGRDAAWNMLTIGRYEAEYSDMAFDELRLYSRALSGDEIRGLAVVPVPGAVALAGLGVSVVGWLRRRRTL